MFEFLFGAKKRCKKVRRSKRDKRKKCKSKKCSVSSRHRTDLRKKCRSKRQVQKRVQQLGGSPLEQAEAAAAVAAQEAQSRGLPPDQIVEAAAEAAITAAGVAGAGPMEVQEAVELAEENARGAFEYDSAMEYDDLNLTALAFGSRNCFCSKCVGSRRTHFGSECSVLPNTPEGCTQYNVNGTFPCYSTAAGCRKRIDKQPKHLIYVVGQTRSPAVRQVLQEEIQAREIGTQTDPIVRRAFERAPRRIGRGPSEMATQTDDVPEDEFYFGKSHFGRCKTIHWIGSDRKKKSRRICGMRFCKRNPTHPYCKSKKGKNAYKRPPSSLIKKCRKYKIKITKKVGKRRLYKSVSALKRELARKRK